MQSKNLLLKPNYAKSCSIVEDLSGQYIFSHIRDFTRISEDEKQPQKWIDDVYDPRKIEKAYYLTESFGPWNLIAHTMISFHFTDGRELCISVEAPLRIGEEYSLLKAILGHYDIMYIWGTQRDHLSLRADLRGGIVHKYLLAISKQHTQDLFVAFVEETKKLAVQKEKYGLIRNNCLTSLWRIAAGQFKIPRWSLALLFSRLTPTFLAKLDIINLRGKRVIKGEK